MGATDSKLAFRKTVFKLYEEKANIKVINITRMLNLFH